MHTKITAVVAGALGIVIGAGGWALLGPDKTVHDQATAAAVSSGPPSTASPGTTAVHYGSAQAIADRLHAAGFTVSKLRKDDSVTTTMGIDAAYAFTVTAKPGTSAGDSGIDLFRSHEALTTWVGMSKALGGIAVTGDTWAVSLTTSTPAAVTSSKALAPRIAAALGGTVQE